MPRKKRCPHGSAPEKVRRSLAKRPISTFAQIKADIDGAVSDAGIHNQLKALHRIGEVVSPAWGFYCLVAKRLEPLDVLRATEPLKYAIGGYLVRARKPLTAEQIREGLKRNHRLDVVESTFLRHVRQMIKRQMLFRVPGGYGVLHAETPWSGYWRQECETGRFSVPRCSVPDAPWTRNAKPAKPAARNEHDPLDNSIDDEMDPYLNPKDDLDPELADLLS